MVKGGACVEKGGGGMRGEGRCPWQGRCVAGGIHGRGHAWQGVCMAKGDMCGRGACMAGETATFNLKLWLQ